MSQLIVWYNSYNAEHVKVCPLEDGRLLVLSSLLGYQKARFSFIDKNARIIKEKKALELDEGYTAGAELVQTTSDDETEYHLIRHNKQDLSEHESKEYITSFKDGANGKRNHKIKNSLFTQTSVASLKNGTLIIAGINHKASFGAETSVEVNIYDPKTDTYGNGKTIVAHSSYISCYEQRDNEVYCVYVSYEDIFLSKLNIRRLIINDNTIELGEPQNIIKVFYTEFNFIKAVKFNENEALVLFQTGNDNSKIEFGNTGNEEATKEEFIEPFVKMFVETMKITKEKDVEVVNNFLSDFVDSLNGETLVFFNGLIEVFDNIKYYTDINKDNELSFGLNKYKDQLLDALKKNDINNNNLITFDILRKIVQDLNIILEDESMEYLIYKMKKNVPENNSIFALNYEIIEQLTEKNEIGDIFANIKNALTNNKTNIDNECLDYLNMVEYQDLKF